jgi:hypothetical protein
MNLEIGRLKFDVEHAGYKNERRPRFRFRVSAALCAVLLIFAGTVWGKSAREILQEIAGDGWDVEVFLIDLRIELLHG